MIELIFFNIENNLEETSERIFRLLSLNGVQTGDSLHIVDGEYKICSILGMNIKLEKNGYDREDKYGYMLSVRKNVQSNIEVSESSISLLKNILCDIISKNLKIEVAYENNNELLIYKTD